MSIKSELYTYLTNSTPLAALVSNRIYPQTAPTSAALPYIVYSRIDGAHLHCFGGAAGIATARFQFMAWSSTSDNAEEIGEALRNRMDGLGNTTWGAFSILTVFLENEVDQITTPEHGEEQGVFAGLQDYLISYRESVPSFA